MEPGRQLTEVELVEVETKGGARVTPKAWRDMVELQAGMTEVEVWAWQTGAKTMGVRSMVEPRRKEEPSRGRVVESRGTADSEF